MAAEFDLSRSDPKMDKHNFMHFKTPYQCDVFLKNNPTLTIDYKCCGGKGLAYFKTIPLPALKFDSGIDVKSEKKLGTCDICFLENVELSRKCNTCVQPFCNTCLAQITNKICPYCRGKLE